MEAEFLSAEVRLVTERHGPKEAAGVGTYGMMRALQFRRSRLPRPQVTRGQFPT